MMMVNGEEIEPNVPEPTLAQRREDLLYRVASIEGLDRFTPAYLASAKAPAIIVDLTFWLNEINKITGLDTLPIDETGVIAATEKVIAALDELAALSPES
jgi:hypothetical protein